MRFQGYLPDRSTEAHHGLGCLELGGPDDVAGADIDPLVRGRDEVGEEVVHVVRLDA